MEILIVAIIIIITFAVVIYSFFFTQTKTLSQGKKFYYAEQIMQTVGLTDREAMVICDKILGHILKDLGYKWKVADQLRAKPEVIPNLHEVWRLHKLRNKLVHELDTPTNNLAREAEKFRHVLTDLLNQN